MAHETRSSSASPTPPRGYARPPRPSSHSTVVPPDPYTSRPYRRSGRPRGVGDDLPQDLLDEDPKANASEDDPMLEEIDTGGEPDARRGNGMGRGASRNLPFEDYRISNGPITYGKDDFTDQILTAVD